MQEARRDVDPKKLEFYLDSLVPGFQKKIRNTLLGHATYPKLRNRIKYPHGRPKCVCVIHDTIATEGLEWMTPWRLARFEIDRKDEEQADEEDLNTE